MNLRYQFSEEEFVALCLKNLKRKKTTVCEDFYETLIYFLSTPDSILIADAKFRSRPDYYDEHLSLKEYIDNGKILLPYVEFELSSNKDTDLEVTNITIPPFVKLNDLQYGGGATQCYKIKNTKLKTKNKSSIRLLTVEFPKSLLIKLYSLTTPPEELLPSKLGVWEWRQTFYNKMTGKSYFCSCFRDALNKKHVDLLIKHAHLANALAKNSFKESICHICTKTNSDLMYSHNMYSSSFKVRYGAYITKHSIQEAISERDAENYIRELKGVAKIGERWVNETLLFNYIKLLFPQLTVQREASPIWLNKLRFDIFIPELNLAIEYQGKQHYVAIDHFGGDESLRRTKQRDKDKYKLSKNNGVNIIYFSYREILTEKLVQNRLKNYLKQDMPQ